MYNFNELVDSFLIEADPVSSAPQWLADLIKKYNELYGKQGETVSLSDVETKIGPLFKGYITPDKLISIGLERAKIVDVLRRIYETIPSSKKPNTFETLKTAADATEASKIVGELANIKTPNDWQIKDTILLKAYETASQGVDRASAVALETYNQYTIFNTVQEMIKRRTNAFDRISSLKSPTTPFKNLLIDIFKTPEQYLSGQKKVTSDWSNIVDGVYITTICNIALNTKDLFQSLLQPPTQQTTNAANKQSVARNVRSNIGRSQAASRTSNFNTFSQQPQPVNASLEYFTQLVEQLLDEQTPGKDYTKDQAAYTNFYINGILPDDIANSKDENNKQIIYNIKKINELLTPEAKKLIASLRDIAQYEKKKAGTGERIAGAQQALQGIASFAGAQLYT